MYGSPSLGRLLPLLGLVVVGFVLPRFVAEYYLYLGNVLMMYAVLAIGLDILLGRAGQFAFAHTAFFGIGCYTPALLNLGKAHAAAGTRERAIETFRLRDRRFGGLKAQTA